MLCRGVGASCRLFDRAHKREQATFQPPAARDARPAGRFSLTEPGESRGRRADSGDPSGARLLLKTQGKALRASLFRKAPRRGETDAAAVRVVPYEASARAGSG
jgi:hypothetical protein